MAIPGWYPDPENSALLRYFDGAAWTEDRQPIAPMSAPPTGSGPTSAYDQFSAPAAPVVTFGAAPLPPAAPYSASAPAGVAGSSVPGAPAATSRRRRQPLLVFLVVVVLVAGGAVWWLLQRNSDPQFTYSGKAVNSPAAVLDHAESEFRTYAAAHHGVTSNASRCYFATATAPAAGSKKTDIDGRTYCGPVLFVDGDTAKPYLSFAISTTASSSDNVSLTTSSTPTQTTPAATPTAQRLTRPDRRTPPAGADGLTPPAPPKAAANVVAASDVGSQTVADAPPSARIGSLNGGAKLTKLGKVTRFGSGEKAFSAPDGQQLYAFRVARSTGQEGNADLSDRLKLVIDGGAPVGLPSAGVDEYVIAAAPLSAKSVTLVLSDQGVNQSISLLDGSPGPGNIAVAARSNTTLTLGQTQAVPMKFTRGANSATDVYTTTFASAQLYYWDSTRPSVLPSSPGAAFLYIDMVYTQKSSATEQYGWLPQLLTLTPTGGAPIPARNVSSDPANKVFNVFEVPASFTTGTLTISGSATDDGITGTVTTPYSLQLTFPAG